MEDAASIAPRFQVRLGPAFAEASGSS